MNAFKLADAASYDDVAHCFAHFTDLVSTPLAATMVRLASLAGEGSILDVGTGSAVVALAAAGRPGARGPVVGLDLSEGLLSVARARAAQTPRDAGLWLLRGDAEALPLRTRSFDCVLSLFALLHFPDPAKAVGEMFRVLRPGGRLVIGIGSRPRLTSITGLAHTASRVPDLVRLATGKLLLAPAHLNGVVRRYIRDAGEPEETSLASDRPRRAQGAVRIIRAAGFRNLSTHWQGGELEVATANEFWQLQSTFSSVARKRLKTATPHQLRCIRMQFDRDCERVLSRKGRLSYPYAAFFICGQRPH